MKDENLIWLLNWFYQQCDGDWEHGNGIKIGTIDNPGWFFKVSLEGTDSQDQDFQPVEINRSENDWVYCSVEKKYSALFGGPLNLPEILMIFREWAESCQKESLS